MLTRGQEASSSTTLVVGRKRDSSQGANMLPNGEKRYVSANDLGSQTEVVKIIISLSRPFAF
ncbi:hypothetical protein GIB67_037041 [Kingdonia uniflora]|uniref:Uncharacterized protein n=1 Tax=Kingdonia uniflora TaxID=39325 RepID=A0A7J7LHL1_9MAGN|nr:hypothetical protein GIB67_037041 [Kingdonia uniflora]